VEVKVVSVIHLSSQVRAVDSHQMIERGGTMECSLANQASDATEEHVADVEGVEQEVEKTSRGYTGK
jgi:hypothetical protein